MSSVVSNSWSEDHLWPTDPSHLGRLRLVRILLSELLRVTWYSTGGTFPLAREGERSVDDDVDLSGSVCYCQTNFLQTRLQWRLTRRETGGH